MHGLANPFRMRTIDVGLHPQGRKGSEMSLSLRDDPGGESLLQPAPWLCSCPFNHTRLFLWSGEAQSGRTLRSGWRAGSSCEGATRE